MADREKWLGTVTVPERRVVAEGIAFAEGPRWHDGALWFSDIPRGRVCRIGEDGELRTVCEVPGEPSGLGWLPDGRLLVVSMRDRAVYRQDPAGVRVHADLTGIVRADLNDMVVGGDGIAYVTGFGYDAETEERRATGVVLVRPDGTAEMQQGDLWRPNGCAISPDGKRLVVAETRLHRVSVQAIEDGGRLGPREDFGLLPSGSWADGMCLDAEGAAWVADPKGHRVFRVLETGEIAQVLDFGADPAIACVLGGPERKTLYVSVGPVRPMSEQFRDPRCRIESVEVDVPGAGWP